MTWWLSNCEQGSSTCLFNRHSTTMWKRNNLLIPIHINQTKTLYVATLVLFGDKSQVPSLFWKKFLVLCRPNPCNQWWGYSLRCIADWTLSWVCVGNSQKGLWCWCRVTLIVWHCATHYPIRRIEYRVKLKTDTLGTQDYLICTTLGLNLRLSHKKNLLSAPREPQANPLMDGPSYPWKILFV